MKTKKRRNFYGQSLMVVFCAEAEVLSFTHQFNILIKCSPAGELLSQFFKTFSWSKNSKLYGLAFLDGESVKFSIHQDLSAPVYLTIEGEFSVMHSCRVCVVVLPCNDENLIISFVLPAFAPFSAINDSKCLLSVGICFHLKLNHFWIPMKL